MCPRSNSCHRWSIIHLVFAKDTFLFFHPIWTRISIWVHRKDRLYDQLWQKAHCCCPFRWLKSHRIEHRLGLCGFLLFWFRMLRGKTADSHRWTTLEHLQTLQMTREGPQWELRFSTRGRDEVKVWLNRWHTTGESIAAGTGSQRGMLRKKKAFNCFDKKVYLHSEMAPCGNTVPAVWFIFNWVISSWSRILKFSVKNQ